MSSFLATYRRPSAKPVFVYESDNIDSDFVCSICQEPFVDPVVEPACRQMFCRACLAAWLMKSSSCPQCRQPTALGRVTLPPRFVTTRLDDLRVVCPSCRGSYARKSLHKHRAICAPCNKKRHEDVECSAKVVACGGAEFGCKFTAPRGRMPAHEEQCWPTLHLALRHQLDKIEKLVRSLEDRRNPQARALDTVKRGVVVDRSRSPLAAYVAKGPPHLRLKDKRKRTTSGTVVPLEQQQQPQTWAKSESEDEADDETEGEGGGENAAPRAPVPRRMAPRWGWPEMEDDEVAPPHPPCAAPAPTPSLGKPHLRSALRSSSPPSRSPSPTSATRPIHRRIVHFHKGAQSTGQLSTNSLLFLGERASTPDKHHHKKNEEAIGRGGLSRMMGSRDDVDFEREISPSSSQEGTATTTTTTSMTTPMKGLHEELSNLDGGRVLGEDDSATELDSYTYSPSPAPGMDDNGGFLDESGRSYSNLSTKDVEELQRVRVAVPEGEEDDAALSDFDSDISDDETGTEGVDASSVMEGAMAGGTHTESPARVGGVTLEDIDDLKKSAYELENEFKFDFADNVMPSFVEKKDKDDAVFEKLMKENEGGGGGGGISGPIPTPYRRKPVQFNCFDGLIADLKEFLGATPFIWLYLLLLGIITAVIGGMMDWAIIYCHRLRYYLARAPHNYWEDWFMWGSTTLFFTALAIAACQLSPVAQGSGIPEIKCILSGVKLKGLLSFKTLVAKVLSLTFGLSSGLMIGKKGPFVHVSSMIANLLSKVRPFHLIRENPQLYQQMIAVGCGMGVSSNFGAPIGGVLFSIEVTSTYYPVRNYLLTFQCAVISAIAYQFVSWQSATAPTNFPRDCWVYTELLFHGALGVVCGLGSAALVKLICQIILKRRWFAGMGGPGKGSAFLVWRAKIVKWLSHPYVYSLWVILGTAIVTFPGNYYFMSLPGLSSLKEMIWLGPLDTRPGGAKDWDTHFPIVVSILLFTLSRFFGLAFSASMPIACGLYAPALIVGAGMGRATGELLKDVFPDGLAFFPQDKVYEILPATYAVIGASAFAAGMSHTLSSAIIIMEITGQMHLLSPIILATSIAFMVSRAFTPSIYDAVTKIKGLPYLPDLEHSMFDMTADDIMERNPLSIPINASPPKVAKIMRKYKDKPTFPVIDAEESRMLLGFVKRKDLIRWLVISTTEPNDEQSTDFEVSDPKSGGLAGAAAAMLGPLTRRKRRRSRNKRRIGQKKGQQDHSSDEEYVMGNRGTVAGRRATGLGEGLGEGEGRHLVGKTYGTFWGREDKGLGSNLPMISEEEALRRVSEKERAGAPAASRLTDIFELKEDTEMPIFKKPPKPAPHAAGPGMMGVASNTPRPMMGGGAVVGPVGSPTTTTTTTTTTGDGADGAVGSGQGGGGGGGSPVGGLEGLRRRSSSSRGAPGELRRRTSSLAALVAGAAAAGGAAGGAVSASGEIRQLYPNRPPLPVIPVPIQILDEMPMPYVHMLFITLKLSDAYVTKKGRLNGLISRETLKQVIDRHKDPMEVFLMQEGLAFKDSWKWNLHQCYRKWRR